MAEPNGIHMDNISTSSQVDLHHDNASFVSSRSDVHRDLPDVIQDESKEDENLRPTDVDRALKGHHIFFISVSGILGIGLYVRSANMLHLGGPGAVIVPFIILGLLAWMVMQCIRSSLIESLVMLSVLHTGSHIRCRSRRSSLQQPGRHACGRLSTNRNPSRR
jgi:hypothetical protein